MSLILDVVESVDLVVYFDKVIKRMRKMCKKNEEKQNKDSRVPETT